MGEHMIGRSRLWVTRSDPKKEPVFVISGDHLPEFVTLCDQRGIAYEITKSGNRRGYPILAIKIADSTIDTYIATHEASHEIKLIKKDLLDAVSHDRVMGTFERFVTGIAR